MKLRRHPDASPRLWLLEVRTRVVGLERQGLRDELHGLLAPALLVGDHAEHLQRDGVGGLDFQDAPVEALGSSEPAGAMVLHGNVQALRDGHRLEPPAAGLGVVRGHLINWLGHRICTGH